MRKCFRIVGMLFFALCLSACGGQQGTAGTEVEESVGTAAGQQEADTLSAEEQETDLLTAEELAAAQERLEHDWRTEEWKLGEETGGEYSLYAVEYTGGVETDLQEGYQYRDVKYSVWGNHLYALECYRQTWGNAMQDIYYMSDYNSLTGETHHWPLEPELPEEYAEYPVYLADFDIQNEQEWVFFFQVCQQGENGEALAYLALHMSPEGSVLSCLDLYPAMQACGLAPNYLIYSDGVYMDQLGNYYLRIVNHKADNEKSEIDPYIYVLSPEGDHIGEIEPGNGKNPTYAMKTPDGNPIFFWYGQNRFLNLLQTYDTEQRRTRELGRLPSRRKPMGAYTGLLTEDGYFYCIMNDSVTPILYRYDLYTGTEEKCLNYSELGMDNNPYWMFLLPGKDGAPLIVDAVSRRAEICHLGRQKPETNTIRLVSLSEYEDGFIQDGAGVFSKRNMGSRIEVERPSGSLEDYRSRVLAELTAGKGADLYYVSAADMQILYENDVLADLAQTLPAGLLGKVYPSILEGGTIEGHMVGLPLEASPYTLIVPDKYWAEGRWSLEELLDMVDAHPEHPYPIIQPGAYFNGGRLLEVLLFQNMGELPFLDLEQGTCDFHDPLFTRVMELAKRYADNPIELDMSREPDAGGDPAQELLNEGNYVALYADLWTGFTDFDQQMAQLGEDHHVVGFPTEGEKNSYWRTDYFLVVNKETAYPEQVYAYLEYLLSEEAQKQTRRSVRSDILRQSIVPYDEDSWGYMGGILDVKPDGSTWLKEYEELLERCMLVTEDTGYIQQIIREEAGAYFSDTKDLQSVIDVIQNRVQLYLKEQS